MKKTEKHSEENSEKIRKDENMSLQHEQIRAPKNIGINVLVGYNSPEPMAESTEKINADAGDEAEKDAGQSETYTAIPRKPNIGPLSKERAVNIPQSFPKSPEDVARSKEIRRKKIRRERRERRISKTKRVVSIVFILMILLAAFYYLPIFRISKYEMKGLNKLSADSVWEAGGIKNGSHIFSGISGGLGRMLNFRWGRTEDKLLGEFPYIKSIIIKPKLFGTISFEIEERVAVSLVENGGKFYLLDKDGLVLETIRQGNPALPLIKGVELSSPKPGEFQPEEVCKGLLPAHYLMDEILKQDNESEDNFFIFKYVELISIQKDGSMELTLSPDIVSEGTIVKLGDQLSFAEGVRRLRYLARSGEIGGLGKGKLDLSGKEMYFYPDQSQ